MVMLRVLSPTRAILIFIAQITGACFGAYLPSQRYVPHLLQPTDNFRRRDFSCTRDIHRGYGNRLACIHDNHASKRKASGYSYGTHWNWTCPFCWGTGWVRKISPWSIFPFVTFHLLYLFGWSVLQLSSRSEAFMRDNH